MSIVQQNNVLAELLLSSTAATSPLPTIQLHSLLTGSLIFSFKSPHASTTTTIEKDVSVLGHRKTMGFIEANNGCGGIVLGLGGKEGRAGINVWGFQKVSSTRSIARIGTSKGGSLKF